MTHIVALGGGIGEPGYEKHMLRLAGLRRLKF